MNRTIFFATLWMAVTATAAMAAPSKDFPDVDDPNKLGEG